MQSLHKLGQADRNKHDLLQGEYLAYTNLLTIFKKILNPTSESPPTIENDLNDIPSEPPF